MEAEDAHSLRLCREWLTSARAFVIELDQAIETLVHRNEVRHELVGHVYCLPV